MLELLSNSRIPTQSEKPLIGTLLYWEKFSDYYVDAKNWTCSYAAKEIVYRHDYRLNAHFRCLGLSRVWNKNSEHRHSTLYFRYMGESPDWEVDGRSYTLVFWKTWVWTSRKVKSRSTLSNFRTIGIPTQSQKQSFQERLVNQTTSLGLAAFEQRSQIKSFRELWLRKSNET